MDAVRIGRADDGNAAQGATPLGAFASQQVALATVAAQHFAVGRYLKPLCHRFLSLNTFGTSHKSSILKERAI
jgi:hypothetical protein